MCRGVQVGADVVYSGGALLGWCVYRGSDG
jgi:hypothetical protein